MACFLVNRMSSTVLGGNVPYSVLFPNKELFSVEPKVFGSTCYVRDVRPSVTKLDPKALKCVFLGYSRLQKGYRCYSTELGKYLVSTDVSGKEDEWLVYQVTRTLTEQRDDVPPSPSSIEHQSTILPSALAPTVLGRPPIAQVYSRRQQTNDTCSAPVPSSLVPSSSYLPPPDPPENLDLPIALRKGSVSIPKTVKEALNHHRWSEAMLEEIHALEKNHAWDLVDLPSGKKAMGCNSRIWAEKSKCGHSVYYKQSTARSILLVVYVDDIVITGSDYVVISSLKSFLHTKFHTKDLGQLKYFLGVEITRSKKGIFLSHRKYILDLLAETSKLPGKACITPMVPNLQLMKDEGDPFNDPDRYRRLVGRLNYLTVTRADITFAVIMVSQFMSASTVKQWEALEQILCYLKRVPGLGILYSNHGHSRIDCFVDADWAGYEIDRRSTTGYCVFVGGNLVSWRRTGADINSPRSVRILINQEISATTMRKARYSASAEDNEMVAAFYSSKI
ncbi:PREDICTED: uncharacterized protein LOC109227823 [Nicotiana attenuata]|uniref:uncharacterized protein LOC109227823 n=1 Tax=Nicotiana attenuata TaxID=49451 RepID=UPI000905235F|nr:PREDICTED: uncharacterized protein LOC109227823 [Nicotiana attenuata]